MQTVSRRLRSKLKQAGQGMAEYIIILAVIVVAGIGIFSALGDVVGNQAAAIAVELSGTDGGAQVEAANTGAQAAVTSVGEDNRLDNFQDNGQD